MTDTRVSYNGYYVTFPRLKPEFDSLHPHQLQIMNVKESFTQVAKSRAFLALTFALFVVLFIILVKVFVSYFALGSQNLQIPIEFMNTRKGVFDVIASSQKAYLLNFAAFAVIVFVANVFISAKLFNEKNRSMGLMMLWLTLAVMMICAVLIFALLSRVTSIYS